MNTWYVLAKKDKRFKYNFYPVFHRSHIFKSLDTVIKIKNLKEKELHKPLCVLKRTCEQLHI